jgi:hypothetical protein
MDRGRFGSRRPNRSHYAHSAVLLARKNLEMAVVFDTHKQHKSLVDAGFPEPQAEAITGVASAVLSVVATKADLSAVATKTDLEAMALRFEAKFSAMDARFDGIDKRFGDFNKSLSRMNALMIGQISATVGGIGIIVGSMFAVIAPHIR